MESLKVLVVIPVFNCKKQIIRVIDEFNPKILDKITRVIIIDNQSSDFTPKAALEHISANRMKKLEVYQNKSNYGLGGTQKVGFQLAIEGEYDYVAIMHGDNQARNIELLDLIAVAEEDLSIDAILGARFHTHSRLEGYSKIRTWGNKAFNLLYSCLSFKKVNDMGSGLNLFKVSMLKKINFQDCNSGLTFNITMLLEMMKKKVRMKYIPITWREDDQVSNAKIFKIGFECIQILFSWRLGKQMPKDKNKYESKKISLN